MTLLAKINVFCYTKFYFLNWKFFHKQAIQKNIPIDTKIAYKNTYEYISLVLKYTTRNKNKKVISRWSFQRCVNNKILFCRIKLKIHSSAWYLENHKAYIYLRNKSFHLSAGVKIDTLRCGILKTVIRKICQQ